MPAEKIRFTRAQFNNELKMLKALNNFDLAKLTPNERHLIRALRTCIVKIGDMKVKNGKVKGKVNELSRLL